ncbi:hypothetical protein GBAR_LOCUS13483 [Geodia barretti]|nr:hypothetical protein GBAR_LOCUS13483 [Geodia barretti]
MRIQARSAAALPPPPPMDEEDATKSSPRHQRLQNIMSDPVSPSAEIDLDFTPGSAPEREVTLRDRGEQSSLRKCARRSRVIPVSHQLEKAKSQLKLQLGEGGAEQQKEKPDTPLFTPDEPTHIATDKLANYQERFREWKRVRDQKEMRSRTSPGVLSPDSGPRQKLCSPVDRRSTISTPTSDRPTSDMSSLDGGYVTIHPRSHGEEEESGESETSLGRLQGLQRQGKIDIHSPHDELKDTPQFIQTRPRTNAISYGSPPLSSSPERHLWSPDRALTNRRKGEEFQCDENTCWLKPRAPPLSATQQKSGSDPQLSTRVDDDLLASAEYLKVLPPNQRSKKTPKKPKPTPRTRKPANLPLPQRTSVYTMTPPTPTLAGGQVRNLPSPNRSLNRGLDVRTLLSSQRSLSESNLFSNLSNDSEDDYVDMSHYQKQWERTQLYVNYNELHPVVPREMSLQRKAMRRQASSSCGNLPAAAMVDEPQPLYENAKCCTVLFGETEVAYENGRQVMEYFMYGQAGGGNDSVDPGASSKSSRRNVTGPCSYGDSGLGSTPSGSPLLTSQQRSFSLDDMRQVAGAQLTDEDQLEMTEELKPERPPKPCRWQFPCCVKVIRGQLGHVTHQNSYENLPLILSS